MADYKDKLHQQIKHLRESIEHHKSIGDSLTVKRLKESLEEHMDKLRKINGS